MKFRPKFWSLYPRHQDCAAFYMVQTERSRFPKPINCSTACSKTGSASIADSLFSARSGKIRAASSRQPNKQHKNTQDSKFLFHDQTANTPAPKSLGPSNPLESNTYIRSPVGVLPLLLRATSPLDPVTTNDWPSGDQRECEWAYWSKKLIIIKVSAEGRKSKIFFIPEPSVGLIIISSLGLPHLQTPTLIYRLLDPSKMPKYWQRSFQRLTTLRRHFW
ncbi:MAG: hypothetical protein CM1200mP35_05520 [Chloroflexota bacterium]|nr:MAG: hypothetical protein CM1200mP35_05520 [Chloroflexota bacterium]